MIVLRVLAAVALAATLVRPAAAYDDAFIDGPGVLGRGLQDKYAVVLDAPTATDAVFVLIADYPDSCLLSSDPAVRGTQFLEVTVPAGRRRGRFWVQTPAGAPHSGCTITGVGSSSKEIAIQTPQIGIVRLQTRFVAGGPSDGFSVSVGVQVPGPSLLAQGLTPDETGPRTLAITVQNSNSAAGQLLGQQSPGQPQPVYVVSPRRTPHDRSPVAFEPTQSAISSDQPTTVTASATGFDPGTRPLVVRQSVVRVAPYSPEAVGIDLQDRFTLRLEPPAQSQVTVTLTVPPGGPCLLAPDEKTPGDITLQLTIGAGRSGHPFVVQGVAEGSCSITATTSSGVYPAATLLPIPITCPGVRLEKVPGHLYQSSPNDDFRIRVGVPDAEESTLLHTQSVRPGVTGGYPVRACAGPSGVLSIPGADVYGCKAATIPEESSLTDDGALALDPGAAGAGWVRAEGADGSCTVTTDAGEKTVQVRANQITITKGSPDAVGIDLQDTFTLELTPTPQDDFTIDLAVNATAQCVLAADQDTGSPDVLSLPIPVEKGRSHYDFVVRGLSPASGPDPCKITATTTANGWPSPTELPEIPIVTPGLRLTGLPSSLYVNAPPEPFEVVIGVPTDNGHTLLHEQTVRPGAGPTNDGLTVEACVSDTSKAMVLGLTSTSPNCAGAIIIPGESTTGQNGLALDPSAVGPVKVWAQADFAETTDLGEKEVTIRATDVRLTDASPAVLGVDLQDTFTVKLEPPVAAGASTVQVTLTVATGGPCVLADNDTAADATSVTVPIPAGRATGTFVVRGLAISEEDCVIDAVATGGYPSATFDAIPIRCAALRLAEGPGNVAVGAADDPFRIEIGPPNTKSSGLRYEQAVRLGVSKTVEACSGDPASAEIIGGASGTPGCASATIPSGESTTADPDLKLSALAAADDVCITATGATCTVTAGRKCIDIGPFGLDIDPTKAEERLGEELWSTIPVKATTQVGNATSVTITSLTPAHCLVSRDEISPAAETDVVTIPGGSNRTDFVLHGIARGECTIQAATASPVTADTETFTIEPTAAAFREFDPIVPSTAAQRYFRVALGVADASETDVQHLQEARNDITLQVRSTNELVGVLRWQDGPNAPVEQGTIVHPVVHTGNSRTAQNDLAFIPVGKGDTEVCVDEISPVGIVTPKGCETVSVDPVDITIDRTVGAIGAGLESNAFTLRAVPSSGLPGGGLPVRVQSLTPGACVVGTSGAIAGTSYFNTTMTGPTSFWVQAATRTAPATCTISVSITNPALMPKYEGDSDTVGIVQTYVALVNAPASVAVGQTLGFSVRVGLPTGDLSDVAETQPVSAKTGAWPITVGLTAVPAGQEKAQLGTTNPSQQGQQVGLSIAAGQHDVTGSGLAIGGVAAGNTTITASGTSLAPTTKATQPVTVTTGGGGGC